MEIRNLGRSVKHMSYNQRDLCLTFRIQVKLSDRVSQVCNDSTGKVKIEADLGLTAKPV